MLLTEYQKEFILSFFIESIVLINYPGAKEIALKLIEKGECIVAGSSCIWSGGIGNFIKTETPEGYFECLKYTFDISTFIKSAWFLSVASSEAENLFQVSKVLERNANELNILIKCP